jgi:hypothetical protein
MSAETFEDILRRDSGSVDETLRPLEALIQELKDDPESWENPTLDHFLEAMHAWLSAVRSRVPDPPSWKLMEMMLRAAKIYE